MELTVIKRTNEITIEQVYSPRRVKLQKAKKAILGTTKESIKCDTIIITGLGHRQQER